MANSIKTLLRSITPPVLWEIASRTSKGQAIVGKQTSPLGEEMPAEYYNQLGTGDHLKTHYTESHYYPTWLVISDYMMTRGSKKILDIGCGPGQFALLLADNGFTDYVGIDFSELRIEYGKKVCPQYSFLCKDIFEVGLIEGIEYDTVIMTEFLEHITKDIEVIERIKSGAKVFGTVPNYGGRAHVRKYESPDMIHKRYGAYFDNLRVRTVKQKKGDRCLQMFDGVRNDHK